MKTPSSQNLFQTSPSSWDSFWNLCLSKPQVCLLTDSGTKAGVCHSCHCPERVAGRRHSRCIPCSGDTAGASLCSHKHLCPLAQEGVRQKIGTIGFPTSLSSATSAVQTSQHSQAAQRRQTECVETAGISHSQVRPGAKTLLTCIYSTVSKAWALVNTEKKVCFCGSEFLISKFTCQEIYLGHVQYSLS